RRARRRRRLHAGQAREEAQGPARGRGRAGSDEDHHRARRRGAPAAPARLRGRGRRTELTMDWINDSQAWVALLNLTRLELARGIATIVFVSILAGRLPQAQRSRGRRLGLLLAMGMRIALLFSIALIMRLTAPWFTVFGHEMTGRHLILLAGGLFLMWKSVTEIHHKLEGADAGGEGGAGRTATFGSVLVQIALLDLVFSLDSVITAVGMAQHVEVMVIAIVISVAVMMVFVNPISAFVERHPTVKMLALSF